MRLAAGQPITSVRIASLVEREWLEPTSTETVHRFDPSSGRVKASVIDRYDALVLAERPVAADPDVAAPLLADAWLARGPRPADQQLLRRLRFAGRDADVAGIIRAAAYHVRSLDELALASAVEPALLRA